MHLIKCNSQKVSNSYLFWHWGDMLRGSSRTKEYKPNCQSRYCIALTGMIKILIF
jgi:hypothetical protein